MKQHKFIHVLISFFIVFNSYSLFNQGNEDELHKASSVADSFFQAQKIIDLPEGQEILNEITFTKNQTYPVIYSDETIHESLFETDIESVYGYRRLSLIRGTNKLGSPIEMRYILLLYKDYFNNTWKVFWFRESVNTQNEVNISTDDIVNPRSIDPRDNHHKYSSLAYWQIMNGEVLAAYKSYERAIDYAKKSNDASYKPRYKHILDKIFPDNTIQD